VFLVVDAEDAFCGYPSLALRRDEFPYAFVPDKLEVFDFTHAVPGTVSVIEVAQTVAGELRAVATELACTLCANAQAAVNARFGFVLFGIPATLARVMLAQERSTDATVHSASGDMILGDRVFFHPEGSALFLVLYFCSGLAISTTGLRER
jgi:hypothetical protein